MKLLAFAASNSRHSINKQLVEHASDVLRTQIARTASIRLLDLNDFELPLYSIDREVSDGIPDAAANFLQAIRDADALLISFAEHNGSYTVAYKNLFDWMSRIDAKVYEGLPMVLLSTSPGARGGANVLKTAVESAPFFGGDVKAHLAIPRFPQAFDVDAGLLTDPALAASLRQALAALV